MAFPNLEEFRQYLKAYSNADYGKVASYYNPELTVLLPNNVKHESKESFLQSLPLVHRVFKETISPQTILMEGDKSFVLMHCYFEALCDVPEQVLQIGKDFKSGDVIQMVVWAFYKWKNGKIGSIECLMKEIKPMDAANTNIDQLLKESRDSADVKAKL